MRLDRGESVFFARQLEHIKIKTYDAKPPELRAFKYIPIANTRLVDNQTTLLKYIMENNPVIKRIDWLNAASGDFF
jgi:hypothetical protein